MDLQPNQQGICKLHGDPLLYTRHLFHMDFLIHKVLYIDALCRLGYQDIPNQDRNLQLLLYSKIEINLLGLNVNLKK